MLLWLHILFVILLLCFLSNDLRKRSGSKVDMMAIRTLYILFILDGAFLVPKAFPRNPILTIIKIMASLCTIGFLEFLMAQRRKNQLSKGSVITGGFLILALIVLGLFTAGFRPWIHL